MEDKKSSPHSTSPRLIGKQNNGACLLEFHPSLASAGARKRMKPLSGIGRAKPCCGYGSSFLTVSSKTSGSGAVNVITSPVIG